MIEYKIDNKLVDSDDPSLKQHIKYAKIALNEERISREFLDAWYSFTPICQDYCASWVRESHIEATRVHDDALKRIKNYMKFGIIIVDDECDMCSDNIKGDEND